MTTGAMVNRQWRLAARPEGLIKESNFVLREEPIPEPQEGQVLVRNLYLSLDPTMRGWVSDRPGYLPPVAIGEVMRGGTIGVVERSRNGGFPKGSHVSGILGWQDYALSDGRGLQVLPENPAVPLTVYLSLFGLTGLTAYFGLLDIGKPQPGETLIVTAAAGAVGSVVGQIGKIKGCRVVGIAGTDEKCTWITDELGFDAAINYKRESVFKQLRELCPNGIDVHFENVGGEVLDAALVLDQPPCPDRPLRDGRGLQRHPARARSDTPWQPHREAGADRGIFDPGLRRALRRSDGGRGNGTPKASCATRSTWSRVSSRRPGRSTSCLTGRIPGNSSSRCSRAVRCAPARRLRAQVAPVPGPERSVRWTCNKLAAGPGHWPEVEVWAEREGLRIQYTTSGAGGGLSWGSQSE